MTSRGCNFYSLLIVTVVMLQAIRGQPGSSSCQYYCNPTPGPFPTIKCISWNQRCDGIRDCDDGVDERECKSFVPTTESSILTTETTPMPSYHYRCETTGFGNCTEPSTITGTVGDYFVFAWPDTMNGSVFKLSIISVTNQTSNVAISIPGIPGTSHDWRRSLVVQPHHYMVQTIDQAMVSMTHLGSDIAYVSIVIRSDVPISVTAQCDARSGPSDSFRVIPAANLDREYYVPVIYTDHYDSGFHGVATISALSEAATVNFTFEGDVLLDGEIPSRRNVNIPPFGTFQAKVNVTGGENHMTVMRVQSSKPVAVVSGSVCGRIPADGNQNLTCEYLAEQFPPFNQWGRNFTVPPFMGRRGYTLMVIAGRDDTNFTKDGEDFTLNQGEHKRFNSQTGSVSSIVSDKPVLVVLFSRSWFIGEAGDASMTLVPPLEQFLYGKQTFQVLQEPKEQAPLQHYIAITAPCEAMDNFVVDHKRLETSDVLGDESQEMCVCNMEIKPGRHYIWQDWGNAPFMVMSYGFKIRAGYGYLIGFNVRNITCQSYDDVNNTFVEYYCDDLYTDFCQPEYNDGTMLSWPKTKVFHTTNSTEVCPLTYTKAGKPIASRRCILTEDLRAVWESPVELGCGTETVVEKPVDLVEVTVTAQNVEEVSETLEMVTGDIETITMTDITAVTQTMTNVVEAQSASPEVTVSVIQTLDTVLLDLTKAESTESYVEDTELAASTSDMVLLMEQQIQQSLAEQDNVTIVEEAIQVQAFKVDPVETQEDLSIRPIQQQSGDEHTSVLLPIEVFGEEETTVSVSFVMYRDDALFRPPARTLEGKRPPDLVLSVSVDSFEVQKLWGPVVLNFPVPNDARTNTSSVSCVFWDFEQNNGTGDWSQRGCEHRKTTNQSVTCACDHLTNFAVLMDYMGEFEESPEPYNQALHVITTIGCVVSIIGLSVTLVVFAIFNGGIPGVSQSSTQYEVMESQRKRLRTSRPRRILVHLCVALLCLYITFLFGIDLAADSTWGCPLVAAMIHYFLLSAIFWQGVEALNIYLMLVRVFSMNVSKFILKGAAFAWGLPALIVGICVAAATEQYTAEAFCFLTQGPVLYAALIAPMALILIHNIIVFILVFRNLMTSNIAGTVHGKKTDMDLLKERLQNALTMTVLMGLTWSFGFLMIGNAKFVFQVLFCLFNSFQGLVVFIIFCWRQEDVRKTLRPHCVKAKRKSKEVVGQHADYEVTSTGTGHHTAKVSTEVRKNVTSTGSTSSTLLLSPNKVKANNNLDSTTFV